MNLLSKLTLTFVLLGFSAMTFIGCANNSNSKNRNGSMYCDPNNPAYCNNRNNLYGNQGFNNCGMNSVMTQYGCRPQGNCPAYSGFDQASNQCIPAAQGGQYMQGQNNFNSYGNYGANTGYYPNSYYGGTSQYYGNGYNNGYGTGYNNGYYRY